MSLELQILLLRIGLIIILYAFLAVIVGLIWQDLRAASRHMPQRRTVYGHLIVVEGGDSGLVPGDAFPIEPVTSLGRDLSNTVTLRDSFASAEHALLSLRDDLWWLEDLGSTNGTFVNGMPVEEPTLVADGDVIRVGGVELKLTLPGTLPQPRRPSGRMGGLQ